MTKVEASVAGYLEALDQADWKNDETRPIQVEKLQDKIAALRERMQALQAIGEQLEATDQQVSLTDPDARAMTMSTDSQGIMGYNVQPPSIHSTI